MSSSSKQPRHDVEVKGDASQHASSSSPASASSSRTATATQQPIAGPSTPILRPPPSPTNHRRHRSGSNVSAASSSASGRRISLSQSSSSRQVPRRSIAHGPAALGESYDSGRSLLFDADESGAGAAQWDDVNLDTVDDAGATKGKGRGGSLFRHWSGLGRGRSIQEDRLQEEEESIAMRGYDATAKGRQHAEATVALPLPPSPLLPPPPSSSSSSSRKVDAAAPGRRDSQALAWQDDDGRRAGDDDDEAAILFGPPGDKDDDEEQRSRLANGHTPPSALARLPPSSHIYDDYDDDDDDGGDEEDALRSGGGARSSSKSQLRFEPLTRAEKLSYAATTVVVVALSIVAIAIGVDWIDWPGDGIGRD